ncbi:MAG: lipopolysaccharide kinase InaA family protein [Candidatus Endonucleobacter sp. (ex Gigantidas childressi)]|nr:lipopolysaccharide kinase InaA family protein [Candidatus Endonucleobacter sp. (ex Gigantidas childressi)]
MNKTDWTIVKPWRGTAVEQEFNSLERIFQINGKQITKDDLSDVILYETNNIRFYIKRYIIAGKGLRKYIGRSRVRAEWENLFFFQNSGIAAANVVAYGEERRLGMFKRGALITQEQTNTTDLAQLVRQKSPMFNDSQWLNSVLDQVATIATILHDKCFIHTDLKWRNILITMGKEPQVLLIDCPTGSHWPKNLLFKKMVERGIIKDLACLDKTAKYVLRRSQRMYFYNQYTNTTKLSSKHKKQIRRILYFFEGRE